MDELKLDAEEADVLSSYEAGEWQSVSNLKGEIARYRQYARRYTMDWHVYIHSDPEILLGKPVVKGTRLAVDFLLGLFAVGWTERQVLENYPTLTPKAIKAIFAYSAECMRDESLFLVPAQVV